MTLISKRERGKDNDSVEQERRTDYCFLDALCHLLLFVLTCNLCLHVSAIQDHHAEYAGTCNNITEKKNAL